MSTVQTMCTDTKDLIKIGVMYGTFHETSSQTFYVFLYISQDIKTAVCTVFIKLFTASQYIVIVTASEYGIFPQYVRGIRGTDHRPNEPFSFFIFTKIISRRVRVLFLH